MTTMSALHPIIASGLCLDCRDIAEAASDRAGRIDGSLLPSLAGNEATLWILEVSASEWFSGHHCEGCDGRFGGPRWTVQWTREV